MSSPSVTIATGNHGYAQIITYRGVINTGNPWDVTGGGVKAAASTSVTVTGVTTTVPDTLIVQAVARDNDNAAAAFSAQANANLTGIVERSDAGTALGNGGGFAVWDGGKATATATGNTTATVTSSINAFLTIALKPGTTLGNGTDPANASLAPGGAATMADAFTFQTSSGTDVITAAVVGLATGTSVGLSLVEITSDDGVTVYGSAANPASDTPSIALSTTTLTATTTSTQYKIRVTPKSHVNMPAPAGATYLVTAKINSWTGTNSQTGTDTAGTTVTIDNASPTGATATSGSAGNARVTLNWTSSASADFATTSGSVMYRWAAATAGAETPTEGVTPTLGATNGTATVACLVSSAAATALVRIDGTAGSTDCTTAALIGGQAYTYRIFQRDTSGNYDLGVAVTVTAASVNVSGFVYSDPNHNLQLDRGEVGTGLTLFAKQVPAATPAGPALQAVAVNAGTGLYQLASVSPGEYIIVIDDNATLADVTPVSPPGWTGTEAAGNVRRNVVVAATELQNLNFGAFNGNLVTGRVFADNGTGAGTANNGVPDGAEPGIGAVVVKLTDTSGATVYGSALTDAAGNYVLWIPAVLNGSALKVTETNPSGWRSTGGNTAAGYDRTTDTYAFTYALGADTPNLNFGDVAANTLVNDGQQTAVPGAVLFYAHTFTPASAGSLTFAATSASGWPLVLLRDANCNGVLDAGEPVLAGPISTAPGAPVCVILKVSVPGGAPFNAQDRATLQADFAYTNASPALTASLTNTDTTTVGNGTAALTLLKSQDNATPLPGATISYTIVYTNNSSGTISSIHINDGTPAFTTFLSASCVLPLPAGVTACAVNSKPALGLTGAIEWTLTGGLLPGASGQVAFAVKVD